MEKKVFLLLVILLSCIEPAMAQENVSKSINNTPKTSLDMKKAATYRNLAEYLKGRVSGVSVSSVGGAYQIHVRGVNSIQGDSSPLFVIDGVTIGNYEAAEATVDILDIKSVEIIKDGAGYGTRGGSGVILIATKKGSE